MHEDRQPEQRMGEDPPSAAELQSLRAAATHDTIAAAAEAIRVSAHTVRWHLNNMSRRYEVRSTAHLIELAHERGWLPPRLHTSDKSAGR